LIFQQHYLECLSQASYLLGDEETGTAVVVDPQRDVALYMEEADRLRLEIRDVVLTHFHADFASGHLELADLYGARVHLGRRAQADYDFEPLADGDRIEYGRLRIETLETPGHTPESICLTVYDLAVSDSVPHAVLTGDTLFIGDVGRPDLLASVGVTAEELAGMLYDSLHDTLLRLPDSTLVYPGHGAGSACGKTMSTETFAPLGEQRRSNLMLQPRARAEFVALATQGLPPAPAYFAGTAAFNKHRHGILDAELARSLAAVPVGQVAARLAAGAQLLDTRAPAEFAAGHVTGSVNVGLEGRFASWAGAVLDRARPVLLVVPEGREREAATRLGRIGFDQVAGFVAGGAKALEDARLPWSRIESVTAPALALALAGASPPVVLDVRGAGERESASIEGSLHVPLTELRARLAEVPLDRRVVVHCASGYRSMIAASLVEARGPLSLAGLEGGIGAWQEQVLQRS